MKSKAKKKKINPYLLALLAIFILLDIIFICHYSILKTNENTLVELSKLTDTFNKNNEDLNLIIDGYNNHSLLAIKRLALIEEYTLRYASTRDNINQVSIFIVDNEDSLFESGYNLEKLRLNIRDSKNSMEKNIEGFESDLILMGNSVLINSDEKLIEKRKKVLSDIQSN